MLQMQEEDEQEYRLLVWVEVFRTKCRVVGEKKLCEQAPGPAGQGGKLQCQAPADRRRI